MGITDNIVLKTLILVTVSFMLFSCSDTKNEDPVNVLILTGRNNHEWQKTTPVLVKLLKGSGAFTIKVTENPDTLNFEDLQQFDVLISNWNSWPDQEFRMTGEWENDFLRYIKEGGGLVSIHAGASSFYDWDDYHRAGIGRWGKETKHGKQTRAMVSGFDQDHPITKGFSDFFIMDEIWEKTDIHNGATAIATVHAASEEDGHNINEPALFVNRTGKGRCFYTTLGHNERTFLNSGFQAVIIRAAQWCAGKEVNAVLPPEIRKRISPENERLTWIETDSSLILNNNSEVIWQLNFNNRFGRPYFHPVNINSTTLTSVAPDDHPWHSGLWFSWKFINGINYWEYLDNFRSEESGYRSAGVTEIKNIRITTNTDFSARVSMEIDYHPAEDKTILRESREIFISSPAKDGSYHIDSEHVFETPSDQVILDRTPIKGEPDGVSLGGYAGLSVRFSQDLTSPEMLFPSDGDYMNDDWFFMGFNTLTGMKAGMSIFRHPDFTSGTTAWYAITDNETPFYYYSPAVLYNGKLILKKGESLNLKYRVSIFPFIPRKEEIQALYDNYIQEVH